MNKLRNLILVMVLAIFASACAELAEPTITGEWQVENVIADEVNLPADEVVYLADSRLHLDPNNTFLFVNVDGRATGGEWELVENTLTLTSTGGETHNYTLVFHDWDKLHIYRTLDIAEGTMELRYLFNRVQ